MSTHHTSPRATVPRPARAGTATLDDGRRPPVATPVLDLLDRSRASLLLACRTGDSAERYIEAHLGALRAAAALLAARSAPTGRSRPRSVWEVLPTVAPDLAEWAAFFAGSARRRVVVERGGAPSARESDDLLRQAETFLEIVQDVLGLPRAQPLPDYLAPLALAPLPARTGGHAAHGGHTATSTTSAGRRPGRPT